MRQSSEVAAVLEQIGLSDGRRLDLYTSGPLEGTALVFHNGTPSGATPFRAIERAAHRRGLRFVLWSRPGYGDSTRRRGRRVVDVVDDTQSVLDTLGISRCLVAGWSGGGPHALACAARCDRVAAALVIAGVAPYDAAGLDWYEGMGEMNVEEFSMTAKGEEAIRPRLEELGEQFRTVTVEGIMTTLASILPEVDKAQLTDEFGEDMAAAFHEAMRTGVDGWLDDALAFVAPWGFDLGEITKPVALWQGSEDLMVPYGHGRWLAEHVPGASAHLENGEGHLSIAIGRLDSMFDELVAHDR